MDSITISKLRYGFRRARRVAVGSEVHRQRREPL